MAELPAGTVTFLFTDLEGSTRLWEEHPDAMQGALARHDEILHDAIAAHDGHIVKTTGDGAHAAFSNAGDAANAAVDAQRALAAEAWGQLGELRVRMGIHTGPAEARDGDYYGTSVNKAARLMSAAHGGQVLVSLASEEHLRDSGNAGADLVDLGEIRLRDLARPERVFQLAADGLTRTFPALQSLDAYPGNLPVHLSSFVGRDEDMRDIAQALATSRLVTLTGVGGVGKTRLATQVAADVLPRFADGAWLCELASANDGDSMAQLVASVLGVSPRAGMSLAQSIVEFLRGRDLLIVLDNCEHLLEASARLAEDVLGSSPGVRILATSREGLAVEGERVVPLRSLPLPVASTVEDTAASDAVRLFVERAEAARPGFVLDDNNRDAVIEICRRLDGIPLALELAAARVAAMSAPEVAQRLDERFRLLTGGRRTAVERQQTLRATVDWSYSLLTDTERVIFDRLGVFVGGFDSAAAEAVCSGDGIEPWDIVDALTSLVAKSMVDVDDAPGGATRYELLETLRAYAGARLDDAGGSDTWRRRHAEHYAAFAERAGIELVGPDELIWRVHFHAELANLASAVTWAVDKDDHDDGELAVRIVAALAVESLNDVVAGVGAWAETIRPLADRSTPGLRAAVLAAAGWNAFLQAGYQATQELCADAIRERVQADCPVPSFPCVVAAGGAVNAGALDATRGMLDAGFEVLGPEPEPSFALAQLYATLAVLETAARRHREARIAAAEGLRIARQIANPSAMAITLGIHGQAMFRDDPEAARAILEESIALTRAGASDATHVTALALLGPLLARDGDVVGALRTLRDAIAFSRDRGERPSNATALACGIEVLTAAQEWGGAGVLAGIVTRGVFAPIVTLSDPHSVDRPGLIALIQAQLGDEEFESSMQRGAAMSYDEVLEYSRCEVDRLLAEAGDA